ncbi:MAG: porin [Nitratireductor sp.]|nr:porin [Nitratireductor sp.]
MNSANRTVLKRFVGCGSALAASACAGILDARADDKVAATSYPAEYVSVCSIHGEGFVAIPGTETCLLFSGEVSAEYISTRSHHNDGEHTHESGVSAQIGLIAINETELGTLASRLLFDAVGVESSDQLDEFSSAEEFERGTGLQAATISLAGFHAGFDADDGGAWNRYSGGGYYDAILDGYYSFHTAMFLEYGGSIGDLSFVAGLQDSTFSGAPGAPDPYAAMAWSGDLMTQGFAVVFDQNGGNAKGNGAVAWRVRSDLDLHSILPDLAFAVWYEHDDGDTDYVKGEVWGATGKVALTENISLYGGYSSYDGKQTATGLDAVNWTAGILWEAADGLEIQAEVSTSRFENEALSGPNFRAIAVSVTRTF